jgi:hypothetical protein
MDCYHYEMQGFFAKTFAGVEFTVNEKYRAALPPDMRELVKILLEAGVLTERTVYVSSSVSPDQVEIRVGLRR